MLAGHWIAKVLSIAEERNTELLKESVVSPWRIELHEEQVIALRDLGVEVGVRQCYHIAACTVETAAAATIAARLPSASPATATSAAAGPTAAAGTTAAAAATAAAGTAAAAAPAAALRPAAAIAATTAGRGLCTNALQCDLSRLLCRPLHHRRRIPLALLTDVRA